MAVSFWKRVLRFKDYLFDNDILFCRTLLEPLHQILRQYEYYRYASALVVGPDDQLWEDLKIPYVKSTWRDGSLDFRTPLHISDMERKRMHGPMFGSYEGRTPVVVISDVNMIKQVLENYACFSHPRVYFGGCQKFKNALLKPGGKWQRVQYIFQPMMYRKVLETLQWDSLQAEAGHRCGVPSLKCCDQPLYGDECDHTKCHNSKDLESPIEMMEKCADIVVKLILEIADESGCVDGKRVFGVYSMDVITRAIFGKPIENYQDPDNKFIQHAIGFLFQGRDDIFLNTVRYPEKKRKPQESALNTEAMEYFAWFITRAVRKRMEANSRGKRYRDMLQDLVDANLRNELTINEICAQIMVLIALSYYSIAFTAAVACFEVSQNMDIQMRLQEEIERFVVSNGKLSDGILDEMTYLESVLNEAMRKYPVTVRIERVCNSSTIIDDTEIESGTVMAIPVYALHHDQSLHPDPHVFNPMRFATTPPFCTFLPFGERHGKCVAQALAMRELKVLMACLLKKVTLLPPVNTKPLVLTSKKNFLLAESVSFRVIRRAEIDLEEVY